MSRLRSITFCWPGSNSIVAPVNTGGWSSRGVTVIGSTRVAVRADAPPPSDTSNEIDAGPKYLSALRNTRERESATSGDPSACVARTEFGSVIVT